MQSGGMQPRSRAAAVSRPSPARQCSRRVAAAVLCLVAVAPFGCSTNRDPSAFFVPNDVGTLVVDAILIVGKPLPRVLVTRALSPAEPYSPDAAAERNASVQVQELPGGPVVEYLETAGAGVYVPSPTPSLTVRPNTTYALTVITDGGELVRAQTTTPGGFAVDHWFLLDDLGQDVRREFATFTARGDSVYGDNQVVYADGLLEARFVRPDVVAFQIGVFSLDPDSDFVIEPEFFDPEDFDAIDRQESSPALEALDGKLRLPWFTIFFQGRYKIRILALDANASDWVRSNPQDDAGLSFGGTLGDNFERPVFHVEGGIGLFGSASADSIGFFVQPRPE